MTKTEKQRHVMMDVEERCNVVMMMMLQPVRFEAMGTMERAAAKAVCRGSAIRLTARRGAYRALSRMPGELCAAQRRLWMIVTARERTR